MPIYPYYEKAWGQVMNVVNLKIKNRIRFRRFAPGTIKIFMTIFTLLV
jgi:hypothetical protein